MSVRMRHPDLGEQEYNAAPEQVPHLRAAGWLPVEGQQGQGEEWPAEAQLFEGQERVKIRHPETGGETIVAASAVPYHQEKGWLVVEDDEPPVEATEPVEAAQLSEPSTRRRRGQQGQQQEEGE